MAKNILLMFLSTVRAEKRDDQITIKETKYKNIAGEPTRTTNESAVRYLLQGGEQLARIFILASKAVREDNIELITRTGKIPYLDESDKPIKHLEYFRKRMSKFLGSEECIPDEAVYKYNENSTGAQNLMSVAEIAGRIQNYAAQVREESGEEVVLHVDLTGGMRHINMMMLDIIRLLEYSGIKIGKLIYSNYDRDNEANSVVEEVNNIYDLFQLIAGVEEFVQFGSVKALKKYYDIVNDEGGLSPDLQRLIHAMENFAEEIKLCHYGQFRDAIIELHDAVNDFKPNLNNLQDLLMARLIERIRKDYSDLLKNRDLDDLKVIRWCVKNGYMQQALTLYTERIPEYLGEHGFIKQTPDESSRLDKLVAADEMGRNRWFYLLNECKAKKDYTIKGLKIYYSAIKNEVLSAIRKNKFDYDAWWQKLQAQLDAQNVFCEDEPLLRAQLELLQKLQKDPKPLLSLEDEELKPLNKIIDYNRAQLEEMDKGHLRFKLISQFIQNEMKLDVLQDFFPSLKFAKDISEKYPRAVRIYEMMVEDIFSTSVDMKAFLSIMDKYFRLKDERNHSNHARHDLGEFVTAKKLQEFIESGLAEIEQQLTTLSTSI